MDPLTVLRDFTIRGELDKIIRVNEEFHFGTDYSFPCSTETGYRSKQGFLYTLETLVYFVQNHHVKHSEYIQNAKRLRIPAVTLPDRKTLLDYLTGKISSSDQIEFFAPQIPEDHPVAAAIASSFPALDDLNKEILDGVAENVDCMAMIRSGERPLKDREGLLGCKNRDFFGVLTASLKREEELKRLESQQRKDGLVAKSRLMGAEERFGDDLGYDTPKPKMLKSGKIGEGVPIILVPSAFQTLITIYNVKEFLEDGVFIPTDVKAKQMKGPKPECVTVQKKFSRDRVVTAYEVRDKPSALKAEDWDRVVAVFVLGKEWQFKEWPFKDHVEIFNKSK